MNHSRDDRIFWSTRIVAGLVVPVLLLAFVILYLFPSTTGERFAWEIRPSLMAAYMGAGYIGGAWLFFNVAIGRHWHRVAAGFLPVTAFTTNMLVDTIIYWERFDLSHFPFLLWLILYIVTPILVPLIWWHNRVRDPGLPEANDVVVPLIARWSLMLLGSVILFVGIIGFIFPDWLISLWVWPLMPLSARILTGWFGLLGVGGVIIGSDSRWSAWRVGLESIAIWQILVVIAAVFHSADFTNGLFNWFIIGVVVVLVGMAALYIRMVGKQRNLQRS
ncbi:MAG: hypothetical protein WAM60_05250 [Candidatus Promineifilaceae bacterium]